MTRLYRYRNGVLEAAWPEFPDDWRASLVPSVGVMTPEELRHVASVIDDARAKMGDGK